MRTLGRGLLLTLVAALAFAQANPRGQVSFDAGNVTIEYGRPSAKGRDVLAMAEPDSYWRLGADQATKLVTKVDLVVGGQTVPPGEYTLLGHFVTSEEFYLVVAKSVREGRPDEVAGKVRGEIVTGQENVEQLTMEFEKQSDGATIVLSWGQNRIKMPFSLAS